MLVTATTKAYQVTNRCVGVCSAAHNVMEKNRRAYLRWCMEMLRSELPLSDGQRCTTLSILAKARRYIEALERESTRLAHEKANLQGTKMQLAARLRTYSAGGDVLAADESPGASTGDIPQTTAALARIHLLSGSGSPPAAALSARPVGRPVAVRRRCVTVNSDADYSRADLPISVRLGKVTAGLNNVYRLRPKKRNVSTPNGAGRLTPPLVDSAPRRLVSVLKPLGVQTRSAVVYAGMTPFRARSLTAVNPPNYVDSNDVDCGESESAFADGDVDMVDVSNSTLEYAYAPDSSPDGGETCGVIEIEVTSGAEPQPAVVTENDDNSSNDSGVIANS